MRIAVLVTTDKRGVFMGYADEKDLERLEDTIKISDIRMCVYWSELTKGVVGLAAHGPKEGSRITHAGEFGILKGVTAVIGMTKEAEQEWLKNKWS